MVPVTCSACFVVGLSDSNVCSSVCANLSTLFAIFWRWTWNSLRVSSLLCLTRWNVVAQPMTQPITAFFPNPCHKCLHHGVILSLLSLKWHPFQSYLTPHHGGLACINQLLIWTSSKTCQAGPVGRLVTRLVCSVISKVSSTGINNHTNQTKHQTQPSRYLSNTSGGAQVFASPQPLDPHWSTCPLFVLEVGFVWLCIHWVVRDKKQHPILGHHAGGVNTNCVLFIFFPFLLWSPLVIIRLIHEAGEITPEDKQKWEKATERRKKERKTEKKGLGRQPGRWYLWLPARTKKGIDTAREQRSWTAQASKTCL